jgi:tRNA (mo5U34)-methyltransferase
MAESNEIAREFLRATEEFNRRTLALGLGDLSKYYWYHTIELPDGLVTPGLYDFRTTYSCFGFPEDLRGKRVLDIGSATGFFAFEFWKRGAEVVSVDLPSLRALDRFPGQDVEHVLREIEHMMFPPSVGETREMVRRYDAEQLYFYLLEGPFEFCRKQLGAKVERCYSSVYDLSAAQLGTFDLVFMGDILIHTINPLAALAAAAPLCRGTLVLAQVMPEAGGGKPAMLYTGGEDPDFDEVQWWWPNQACLMQLLRKFRFPTVTEAGHHTGILRPSGYKFDRVILHATR